MAKDKLNILTGGMILITLGVLIYLSKAEIYSFSKTWPILLIVVGVCTLIQRFKDIGGWFITCLLYTSPSPRDRTRSRMPSSA